MKHLFVVHSGTTALVASLTTDWLKLEPPDVVVLTGRGMASDFGFRGLEIHDLGHITYGRNVLRFRREVATFDRNVETLVESADFAAYLPGLYTEQMYALSSHPRCCRAALIEEGTGSYTTRTRRYSRRNNRHPFLARIAGFGRFPADGSDQSRRLSAAYCVSPEAFPDWPAEQKHVLDVRSLANAEPSPFDAVFTGETISERGRATLDEYERVVEQAARILYEQGFRRFGVKFHPNNIDLVRERVAAALKRVSAETQVIESREWLERWMGPEGPLFVGATSSVLHYAVLAGGRAVSFCDLFEGDLMPDYFTLMIPASSQPQIERLRSGEG